MNTQPYLNTRDKVNLWKDADHTFRRTEVAKECDNARKRMGQVNISDEVYKIALVDLLDIIEENYSWFSIDEIKYVLQIGPLGYLGDNISISTRTLATWFKNYLFEYRTQIAAKVREETPALPPSTVPRQLSDQEIDEYFTAMYDLYHEDGTLFAQTFDILHKYGKIQITKAEALRFIEVAKIQVAVEQKDNVAKGLLKITDYVHALENGQTMEQKIDAEVKRMAVANLFDKMKLREKPVEKIKAKRGSLMGYGGKIKLM